MIETKTGMPGRRDNRKVGFTGTCKAELGPNAWEGDISAGPWQGIGAIVKKVLHIHSQKGFNYLGEMLNHSDMRREAILTNL